MTQYENQIAFSVVAFQDISDRKHAAEQLIYNALHDTLTDLPNRALLLQRLELAIERAQRIGDDHFAVLVLDLDRFKVFNDRLGHLVGEQILTAMADKLRQIIRSVDLAARLGGTDFNRRMPASIASQVSCCHSMLSSICIILTT